MNSTVLRSAAFVAGRRHSLPASVPRRVLLICDDYIGDVVLFTAVIELIKKKWPTTLLDVFVNSRSSALLVANPQITELISDPVIQYKYGNAGNVIMRIWQNRQNIRIMRRQAYSIIADFSGNFFTACISLLARGRFSIGRSDEPSLESAYTRFKRTNRRGITLMESMLDLLDCVDISYSVSDVRSRIYLGPEHRISVHEIIGSFSGTVVVMSPFAGWRNKEWPLARFIEVAMRLCDRYRAGCYIVGSHADVSRLQAVSGKLPEGIINLCGVTSLLESAALIERADLFIGLDSSMAKIATAIGTSSVIIYGGTNPTLSAPIDNPHCAVLQSIQTCSASDGCEYCGDSTMTYQCPRAWLCMEQISVAQVLNVADELLVQVQKEQNPGTGISL